MITVKTCTKCHEEKEIEAFRHRSDYPLSRVSWCRVCIRKAHQERVIKNREHMTVVRQKWVAKNRELYNLMQRNHARKLKLSIFEHYGSICSCCGETTIEFLCLDHVNGGGLQHRRSLKTQGMASLYRDIKRKGFPADIRILCFNCNQGRQRTSDKRCPHEKSITKTT